MLNSILYVLKQIASSVLRIEHKLDLLLKSQEIVTSPMVPSRDPISGKTIAYYAVTLEDASNICIRVDGNVPQIDQVIGSVSDKGVVSDAI